VKRCFLLAAAALQLFIGACSPAPSSAESNLQPPRVSLPAEPSAIRFAVIGDSGTGEKPQYDVALQMERAHDAFPFTMVLMLGDNLYGNKTPADYKRKFEDPYKPLLGEGVKFYACLGNHDDPNERYYKPFNMHGQRYYTFHAGDVEFFALDSSYFDPPQYDWLARELAASSAHWKICFFHHPLYSAAHYHGPDIDLRSRIEPLFEKFGVNLVLSGHEHVYERIKPQFGIYYFVLGSAGQLRAHDLRPSAETAKGFDTDRTFMLMEISGDELDFQTLARSGSTVDSGDIHLARGH
jgi:Calcineurin-like phosphoesterase